METGLKIELREDIFWVRIAEASRQKLIAAEKCAAQKEQIVEASLFLSGLLLEVDFELLGFQRIQNFSLLPR